MFCWYWT